MVKSLASLVSVLALVFAVAISGDAVAADKTETKKKAETTTSPCQDLTSSKCKGNKQCVWVKGYTNKDGSKVQAYCRAKPEADETKKKAATTTASCQDLTSSKCKGNKHCVWVKGYTNKDGSKVKAYCRAKPEADETKNKSSEKKK